MAPQRLFIRRAALPECRLGPDPDAPEASPLAEGQARLQIESFALTANNITYAAFGQAMQYWNFFPAPDAAFGCLPVWGFATVTESRAEGLQPGRRVWGYLPAGTHGVVQPGRTSERGFADAAPHRAELAAVYNQYSFCADAAESQADALRAVLQPLFTTSFLIDDFLADHAFFGAQQVLLSSASSKTAYGTAFCLAQRRERPAIVGLTSAGNADFVRSLGCYDRVRRYDDLPTLDFALPTVYVDFAGSAPLRRAVHEGFAATLAHSASIGGTHWAELGSGRDLPGPRPTLFFAPAQIKKRSAPPPEGWGRAVFEERLAQAWAAFTEKAGEGWLQIEHRAGMPAVQQAYLDLLAGRGDARAGLMFQPQG